MPPAPTLKAREQGDGPGRHHGKRPAAEIVAAFTQRPNRALLRLDQPAIVVAHVDAELTLGEIPIVRIGRSKIRQLKDSFVYCREREIRLLAAFETLDRDGQGEFLARQNSRRSAD